MSKSRTMTYWLEIPVKVHFTVNEAEKMTLTYPGCDRHIEIDELVIPPHYEIQKLLPDDDRMAELCWEDLKE